MSIATLDTLLLLDDNLVAERGDVKNLCVEKSSKVVKALFR